MQPSPESDGNVVIIMDYFDSDSAALAAKRALEAADIPYHLERATGSWSGVPTRMQIHVPADRLAAATAVLRQAERHGVLIPAKADTGMHNW